MSRETSRRLAERYGEPQERRDFVEFKPRLPDWILNKVLEQCHGQPSEQLMAWLETRQHTRDDIARWHADIQPTHWQDSKPVLAAGMSLADHPMRSFLGGMLSALVNRHAPHNQGFLPPEFVQEPV